jgi:hypothetical protein
MNSVIHRMKISGELITTVDTNLYFLGKIVIGYLVMYFSLTNAPSINIQRLHVYFYTVAFIHFFSLLI